MKNYNFGGGGIAGSPIIFTASTAANSIKPRLSKRECGAFYFPKWPKLVGLVMGKTKHIPLI